MLGTGYNHCIDWNADGFLAVSDSVHLLSNMSFAEIYVDEVPSPMLLLPTNVGNRFIHGSFSLVAL